MIEETLKELCDRENCCLVVTTGGTGPARRDVTPEATEAVCDKVLDGFGELMRAVSLQVVPTAILSRQIAGIRGQSLIVNLPGKPSAIRDCLLAVFPADPLLHRSDRGAVSDDPRSRGQGLPPQEITNPTGQGTPWDAGILLGQESSRPLARRASEDFPCWHVGLTPTEAPPRTGGPRRAPSWLTWASESWVPASVQ